MLTEGNRKHNICPSLPCWAASAAPEPFCAPGRTEDAMQRRRGAGPRREGDNNGTGCIDEHVALTAAATATTPVTSAGPATVLRKPRHGGWKGTEPGREEQMLRGEPGYHLGGYP